MRSWGSWPGVVAGLLLVAGTPLGVAQAATANGASTAAHTTATKGASGQAATTATTIGAHKIFSSVTKPYEGGKINPHLTEGECRELGGATAASTRCLSGQVCNTSDETGYDHWVCISKTQ
jgi:hypothetical protein